MNQNKLSHEIIINDIHTLTKESNKSKTMSNPYESFLVY